MILRRVLIAAALALVTLCTAPAQATLPVGDALYRSWRNALPSNLFALMESDCRAMSDYEHRGVALKDGKRVTRWMPLGSFPRTALEEAILHLVKLAKPGPELVGFEWWIQKISSAGPMGFHVDKDESVASNEHRLLHPIWSSVFYVTPVGGGTLITNQFSPSGNGYTPVVATEAAWSFPLGNKFLRFNGTLLHGVVPLTAAMTPPPDLNAPDRITFLVNFWHVKPKEPNCQLLRHEDVPGLRLLSEAQILQLRAGYDAATSAGGAKPKRQPLSRIDMSPESSMDVENFNIKLPGGMTQDINLPVLLAPAYGQTYHLQYERASKQSKQKKKTKQSKQSRKKQAQQEEEEEEDDEEEEAPKRKKKKKQKQKKQQQTKKQKKRSAKTKKKTKRQQWPEDEDEPDEQTTVGVVKRSQKADSADSELSLMERLDACRATLDSIKQQWKDEL